MKPEIAVITSLYAPTLAQLEREYVVHELWSAADRDAVIRNIAPRVRALVTTGFVGFKRADLDPFPQLELVACFGNGHNTYDLVAAQERGILVTNTPDPTSDTVAELAVGLLVTLMRRICEGDRYVRAGLWERSAFPLGHGLRGKTCGIVGLGNIGRGVAQRVEAFGMSACYHGPREKAGVPYRYHADLERMAKESDCLVIACPATPRTRNLVDARILDALGPEGFLVNVARGAVVDEAALISALEHKRIAGAGLDVYWDEPRVPDKLMAMEHVVVVPHIGSSTVEIREERGAKLLANLRAHFAGKPVIDPVSV